MSKNTATLFDYPAKAAFGRVLPKTKIYEHGSPSSKVKELFVRQVEQIKWSYKLAPETINIKATKSVPEIQIFNITLKGSELNEEVLRCIDKAIAFPVVYEIYYNDKCRMAASYKRPNEADAGKWVISDYFETPWLPATSPRQPLPVALDLGGLYEALLSPLLPFPARDKEGLQARVERLGQIRSQERELAKIEARLRREKQFNRKVEINAEIRTIKQQLAALTGCLGQ